MAFREPFILIIVLASALVLPNCHVSAEVTPAAAGMAQLRQEMANNRVWMSPQEQMLIGSYLTPNVTMLEWGSGFSTMWYSQFVANYYSIEHDASWYKKISSKIGSLPTVRSYVLKSVKREVYSNDGNYEQFKDYVHAVDDLGVKTFDVILVDGRARAACAAHALLYTTSETIVIIHDYWLRVGTYGAVVAQYYDIVASVHDGQSLVILRRKKDVPAISSYA